jgi:hypothetical protein
MALGKLGSKDSNKAVGEHAAAAKSAKDALVRLIDKLKGWPGTERIKLIIYFDEAHPLTKVIPKSDDEKTLYDLLCSCLNQFLASPTFFIFLSTNSSLAQFAAPRALAKSARIRGGIAVTHAPITETPFDCSDDLMVKPGELSIEEISKIPFMAKFGRPLRVLFQLFIVSIDILTFVAIDFGRCCEGRE